MNVIEVVQPETEKIEGRDATYQGILLQGVPAKPTIQQVDALVQLIVQIMQRSKQEGSKDE